MSTSPSLSMDPTTSLLAVAMLGANKSGSAVYPNLKLRSLIVPRKILALFRHVWLALRMFCGCIIQEQEIGESTAPSSYNSSLAGEHNSLVVETVGTYPLGMGGSSDVWKGRIIRPSTSPPSLVAIKVLRLFKYGFQADYSDICKRLQREVEIWKSLSHESISGFHGVVYSANGAPAIVSPWYENGSVDMYLKKCEDCDVMKLIWEVLLGVEYLHDHDIVHGDLKGANIMVDDAGHARLIDFGLSRLIDPDDDSTGMTLTSEAFSVRWCAPEVILSETVKITKAVDIYAFASTMLELLSGDVPYGSNLKERHVLMMVLNKIPPKRPTATLQRFTYIPNIEDLWLLLESCWVDATDRPNISGLKEQLRRFYADAPPT